MTTANWHLSAHAHHTMDSLLAPLAIATLSTVSYMLTELGADTHIPLGPTLAVFASVGGMVWWLGRKLQAIEDRIERVERDLSSRPCQINGTDCIVRKQK